MPCYRKRSIKPPPPGAYLISDLPEGGLNREGGLLERGAYSQHQVTSGSFSVLLSNILRNQHTILRLKYVKLTQFYSKTCQN